MPIPLIDALKSGPDDRRVFKRYPFDRAVMVWPIAEEEGQTLVGPRRTARTRDISLTGLYFTSDVEYREGSKVGLQIGFGVLIFELQAQVVRTAPLPLPGRQVFGHGIQFMHTGDIVRFVPVLARYLANHADAVMVK